ncbi:MAG: diguanylate cyclase [Solirubrobacteraceae bacterium]|nr:diguanylate cyclase [Solirubrobacteraceae bacterium]
MYRARRGEREYAVKVHGTAAAASKETARGFRREAAILSQIRHPGLVHVYAVGEHEGVPYLVMELLLGRTLGAVQEAADEPMSERRAVALGRDCAGALAAAHRAGLVHRDLKPENIILTEDGRAKLIDFGLATNAGVNQGRDVAIGTLRYSPPEQTGMLKRPVDGRSDLYTLGVVLFEMLCGHVPFEADDVGELVRLHAVAAPPDVRTIAPEISPALAAIVARLLAKDPDDRYQTGEGLLADFDRLAAHTGEAPADFPLGLDDDPTAVTRDLPLIGREAELRQLRGVWQRASEGRGSALVLEGASGVGKSRLVRELLGHIREAGGLTLSGKVVRDNPVPLASLREAVEAHLQRIARLPEDRRADAQDAVRRAAAEAGAMAVAFSPLLAELVGEAATETEHDGERQQQYYAAVASFLTALAREHGRMALWIDDVQWLDDASRRVLELTALELKELPLLLVATGRDDAESAAAVARLTGQLGKAVRTRTTLEPLDEDATADLVTEQLGGPVADERFAEQIFTRSGGNAFATLEYVRAVVHAGLAGPWWGVVRIDSAGLDEITLPDDVMGLVLARVSDLGDDARWLLSAGAALGTRFRPSVLVDVLGYDDGRVQAAVADALRERLIERLDGDECAYVHDRIREALLGRLSEAHLRALHQRIAEVLEGQDDDSADHTFAVARHYALGEADKTPQKVFDWSVRAGDAALAAFAAAEANEFFTRANEVAEATGVLPDAHFLQAWGAAQLGIGEMERANATFAAALERSDDPIQKAWIHRLLARGANATFDCAGATRHAEEGLRGLGRKLPATGVLGLLGALRDLVLCVFLLLRGIRANPSPAEYARIAADARLYQEAEFAAYMEMRTGRTLVLLMRTLSRTLRLGPSTDLSHTLVNVSVVAASLGSRRLKNALLRRGIAMAEETGDPQVVAHARLYEFFAAEMLGDTREAGELAKRVLPDHGRWLDLPDLLNAVPAIAFILSARGHAREARDAWLSVHARVRNMRAAGVDESSFLYMGYVVLEAVGARAEAAELYATCHDREQGAAQHNLFLRQTLLQTSLIYQIEQREFGAVTDELLAELAADKRNPHTASPFTTLTFLQPAMVAVERGERLDGEERAEQAAIARTHLKRLRFVRLHPLLSGIAKVVEGGTYALEGKHDKALKLADQAEALAVHCDAPAVHCDVARLRARVAGAAGDVPERGRQAVIAMRTAYDAGMPGRGQAIAAEFGLSGARMSPGSSTSHGVSSRTSRNSASSTASPGGGSLQGTRTLDALLALSLAASRTHDQTELVSVALDQLVSLLGAERAFLFLDEDPDLPLVLSGARGPDGRALRDATGYAGTIIERVRTEQEALVVTGTEEGAALGSESAVQHGLRSILAAPLVLEGRLLGVLYLDSRLARGIFTGDDVEILGAISTHIAISLETARASDLEQAVAAERDQRGLAETLRDSMVVISATLEPEKVIESTLAMAARSIAYDRAAVLLLGRRGWRAAAVAGDLDAALVGPFADDPREIVLTADAEGKVVADVGGGSAPLPALLGDSRSWLSVPLRARGELMGILVMGTDAPDGFGVSQLELAATFAGQGVVAYENARLFAAVEQMATTDDLTKVYNRRHFFELGEKQFATARRYGPPMSAMMLDIDHFKQVNDRYGHAAGDDVIREVARRLGDVIRTMDIMGRYGGEEFAFVLPETGESAIVLGERLRTAIESSPVVTCEGEISVTVSVGIALMRETDTELADTLNRADTALYEAKRTGRNRVVVAPPTAEDAAAAA